MMGWTAFAVSSGLETREPQSAAKTAKTRIPIMKKPNVKIKVDEKILCGEIHLIDFS